MDNDLKELLAKKSKELTVNDYRKLYGKIDEMKKNIARLQYDRRQAIEAEDYKKAYRLNGMIKQVKATKLDYTAKVKNQYIIKLPTDQIVIKQSTLRRSKNPTKYIEDKIREKEIKQIANELEEGNEKQASSLLKLHKSLNYKTKNKKQEKRLKELEEELLEKSRLESEEFFEEIDQFVKEPEKKYIPIISLKGNVIKVTKVA